MEGWKRLVRRPRSSMRGGGGVDKDEETTAEPKKTEVGDGGAERAARDPPAL